MAAKKKPAAKQREYIVRMRVTLSGAEAIVSADSPEHARKMAEAGEWEDGYDTAAAETINWEVESVEENI